MYYRILPPKWASWLTHLCPIPCFGSLVKSKILTPVVLQILIYLPMFGPTINRLTMYVYTVVFKFRYLGGI